MWNGRKALKIPPKPTTDKNCLIYRHKKGALHNLSCTFFIAHSFRKTTFPCHAKQKRAYFSYKLDTHTLTPFYELSFKLLFIKHL